MKQAQRVTAAVVIYGLTSVAFAQTTQLADTTSVTSEGVIHTPVAEVWKAFSTAEGFRKLGVAQAVLTEFKPGGLFLTSYDPKAEVSETSDAAIVTEIVAFEPGRTLVTRIKKPPMGFPFMEAYKKVWTVISLADLGEGRTNVRVTMVGFGPDEESQKMRDFFRAGNAYTIKVLQSKLEGTEMPKGAAHAEGKLDPIELTQVVNLPKDQAWKLYTTAEGWKALFKQEPDIGAVPGEAFVPFKGTEGNKILAIVPGEMFAHTWNAPAKFTFAKEHHTWVVVNFEELSPGVTRVKLRHYGFEELTAKHPDHAAEFEQIRAYFRQAWPRVFKAMAEIATK